MPSTERVLAAIGRILRPVVRILIRNGVPSDALTQLVRKTFVDVAASDFRLNGKRQTVSDSTGRLTAYEYDGRDRLERKISPEGGLKYTYDKVGNPMTYLNDVPAPVSNLFSGPTKENYTYDPYERVVAATGEFQLAPDKLQHFSQSLTFDARGNVTTKNQLDQIRNGKKELTQTKTTYSYNRTFNQPAPHQISKAGTDNYAYDKDGNLTKLAGRVLELACQDRELENGLISAAAWTDFRPIPRTGRALLHPQEVVGRSLGRIINSRDSARA